jgi:hypothetical protein
VGWASPTMIWSVAVVCYKWLPQDIEELVSLVRGGGLVLG